MLNFDRSTPKHRTLNIQNDCHQWLSDSFRVHQIRFGLGLRPGLRCESSQHVKSMRLVQAVYADKEMSLDKINAMIAIVKQSESQKEARTFVLFKCRFLKYYDSRPAD